MRTLQELLLLLSLQYAVALWYGKVWLNTDDIFQRIIFRLIEFHLFENTFQCFYEMLQPFWVFTLAFTIFFVAAYQYLKPKTQFFPRNWTFYCTFYCTVNKSLQGMLTITSFELCTQLDPKNRRSPQPQESKETRGWRSFPKQTMLGLGVITPSTLLKFLWVSSTHKPLSKTSDS